MDLSRGILVTGAEGQLGSALCDQFRPHTRLLPLTRAEWDVTLPPRSERADARRLPHWRKGLQECLERMRP